MLGECGNGVRWKVRVFFREPAFRELSKSFRRFSESLLSKSLLSESLLLESFRRACFRPLADPRRSPSEEVNHDHDYNEIENHDVKTVLSDMIQRIINWLSNVCIWYSLYRIWQHLIYKYWSHHLLTTFIFLSWSSSATLLADFKRITVLLSFAAFVM